MANAFSSLEEEISALLSDADAPLAGGLGAARPRLLESVAHLERFVPFLPQVAAALGVAPNDARRALHALSDEGGWVLVPVLPDLKIRPVRVGAREIDGAVFAAIEPGGRIPDHEHHGSEVMVVLQGALYDPAVGVVSMGGTLPSDDGTRHALEVPREPAVTCLCLVVNQGWAEYL